MFCAHVCVHILGDGNVHRQRHFNWYWHKARTVIPTIGDLTAIDAALIELRQKLFQAMGIVRLASSAIRDPTIPLEA
jgi:hypothetical protein